MSNRTMAWFKNGTPWDVKFTGLKINLKHGITHRCWNKLTVFVYSDDRRDVIDEAVRAAEQYGYHNVTIDHMVRME